jgi:hypothetical protein
MKSSPIYNKLQHYLIVLFVDSYGVKCLPYRGKNTFSGEIIIVLLESLDKWKVLLFNFDEIDYITYFSPLI